MKTLYKLIYFDSSVAVITILSVCISLYVDKLIWIKLAYYKACIPLPPLQKLP